MNDLQRMQSEAANIANEAMQDAGFQKMIKFKKVGETSVYICDGEEIPLGSQRVAHCIGWTKVWIKFENNKVAEKRIYRVAKGERAPERDELGDLDESLWPIGLNGRPADPWVLQYLLPLEDLDTDEVQIFVASSFGGKRAVADLCSAYARRVQKSPMTGQPTIRLQKTMMPTKNFGNVPRPEFQLVGYSEFNATTMKQVEVDVASIERTDNDMNDEIPF